MSRHLLRLKLLQLALARNFGLTYLHYVVAGPTNSYKLPNKCLKSSGNLLQM